MYKAHELLQNKVTLIEALSFQLINVTADEPDKYIELSMSIDELEREIKHLHKFIDKNGWGL